MVWVRKREMFTPQPPKGGGKILCRIIQFPLQGVRGVKKGEETTLSLHLTWTGNITRRYWLLPFTANNY